MFAIEFANSMAPQGTSHALDGAPAIYNLEGTYSTHTSIPSAAAKGRKAAQIWDAMSVLAVPEIRDDMAPLLTMNSISGVFLVYSTTGHNPSNAARRPPLINAHVGILVHPHGGMSVSCNFHWVSQYGA